MLCPKKQMLHLALFRTDSSWASPWTDHITRGPALASFCQLQSKGHHSTPLSMLKSLCCICCPAHHPLPGMPGSLSLSSAYESDLEYLSNELRFCSFQPVLKFTRLKQRHSLCLALGSTWDTNYSTKAHLGESDQL